MSIRCQGVPTAVKTAGFTLLEILLVVLIIGIMTVAGANLINSQSIERVIMNQAKQFETNLHYICEKAVFENQAFGIEWQDSGYQVLRHQQASWLVVEQQATPLPDGINSALLIDGIPQILAAKAENLPHIICQSDGSFNAFELRLAVSINPINEKTYYVLRSTSPWELSGGWHQP